MAPHSHIRVVEKVVEAVMVMEKSMTPVPMTKSTGRTRNATSDTEKDIQQRIVLRSQVTMMIFFLASTASSVKKFKKYLKSINKAFTRSTPILHS
jgi:hypothetical protein